MGGRRRRIEDLAPRKLFEKKSVFLCAKACFAGIFAGRCVPRNVPNYVPGTYEKGEYSKVQKSQGSKAEEKWIEVKRGEKE